MIILRFRVFRLICLLLKIIVAAIVTGLVVMRKILHKNGKNAILGHIVFCIGLTTFNVLFRYFVFASVCYSLFTLMLKIVGVKCQLADDFNRKVYFATFQWG